MTLSTPVNPAPLQGEKNSPSPPFTQRGVGGIGKLFSNQIFGKETFMEDREKLLGEIFELALQHDMNYFG